MAIDWKQGVDPGEADRIESVLKNQGRRINLYFDLPEIDGKKIDDEDLYFKEFTTILDKEVANKNIRSHEVANVYQYYYQIQTYVDKIPIGDELEYIKKIFTGTKRILIKDIKYNNSDNKLSPVADRNSPNGIQDESIRMFLDLSEDDKKHLLSRKKIHEIDFYAPIKLERNDRYSLLFLIGSHLFHSEFWKKYDGEQQHNKEFDDGIRLDGRISLKYTQNLNEIKNELIIEVQRLLKLVSNDENHKELKFDYTSHVEEKNGKFTVRINLPGKEENKTSNPDLYEKIGVTFFDFEKLKESAEKIFKSDEKAEKFYEDFRDAFYNKKIKFDFDYVAGNELNVDFENVNNPDDFIQHKFKTKVFEFLKTLTNEVFILDILDKITGDKKYSSVNVSLKFQKQDVEDKLQTENERKKTEDTEKKEKETLDNLKKTETKPNPGKVKEETKSPKKEEEKNKISNNNITGGKKEEKKPSVKKEENKNKDADESKKKLNEKEKDSKGSSNTTNNTTNNNTTNNTTNKGSYKTAEERGKSNEITADDIGSLFSQMMGASMGLDVDKIMREGATSKTEEKKDDKTQEKKADKNKEKGIDKDNIGGTGKKEEGNVKSKSDSSVNSSAKTPETENKSKSSEASKSKIEPNKIKKDDVVPKVETKFERAVKDRNREKKNLASFETNVNKSTTDINNSKSIMEFGGKEGDVSNINVGDVSDSDISTPETNVSSESNININQSPVNSVIENANSVVSNHSISDLANVANSQMGNNSINVSEISKNVSNVSSNLNLDNISKTVSNINAPGDIKNMINEQTSNIMKNNPVTNGISSLFGGKTENNATESLTSNINNVTKQQSANFNMGKGLTNDIKNNMFNNETVQNTSLKNTISGGLDEVGGKITDTIKETSSEKESKETTSEKSSSSVNNVSNVSSPSAPTDMSGLESKMSSMLDILQSGIKIKH